jgi:hypothetical protein
MSLKVGATMVSLFGLLLAVAVSNGDVEGQHVAGRKVAAQQKTDGEHSIMKQAMDGVSALANVITPIPAANTSGDKNAEPVPAGVVWVHLSKGYLADYVERNVDHNKPARENVLGIIFTGTSRTNGKTRLVLRPNDREAAADVEFTGTVHANTIGHSGPATLRYLSESSFHARKKLILGENGVNTSAATVEAPTRLIPTSIGTSLPGLRGRIGDRIARRREAGSRSQAEAIVGRDTANDIRHDFDKKLNEAVAEIQSKVQAQIAALKLNGGDGHVVLRSRSTQDFIEVAVCRPGGEAERLQVASATPFTGNPDCSVCIHRSLMASLASNAELRDKFAPALAGVLVAGGEPAATASGPKLSMADEWLTVDFSGQSSNKPESPRRIAAAGQARSR